MTELKMPVQTVRKYGINFRNYWVGKTAPQLWDADGTFLTTSRETANYLSLNSEFA